MADEYIRTDDGSLKPKSLATPDEIERSSTLDWLYNKFALAPWRPPPPVSTNGVFNLTDLGNAERLADHYGHIVRYCYERKRWLVWTGKVWEWDAGAKVSILAKLAVRNIYHEAGNEVDDKKRKEIANHAKASESDHRINAMVNLAQSEPGIPIEITELDTDPWLLNCLNGMVDLRTGRLIPHDKAKLITQIIPLDYMPDAKCPQWLAFIDWLTGKDQDLATYIQRAIGYSLTGDVTEQIMFFIYGLGNNGKSTLTMTIRTLVAGYGERLDADDLMVKDRKSGGGPKEGIANLFKKRYALGSEVRDGRRLDVSQLKDMTGGETMKARHLYEREFEFMPTHKLWLYGNKKPSIHDTSLAVWRRVKLIPFSQTIPDDEIDRKLGAKLVGELQGILAWAIRGCLGWQQHGFNEPNSVATATQEYRHEQDLLGDYILDNCVLGASSSVLKSELRDNYEGWCRDNKIDLVQPRAFRSNLIERGITDFRGTAGKHYWKGVRLLTEQEWINRQEGTEGDESDCKLPSVLESPHTRKIQKDFTAESVPNVTNVTNVPKTCGVCGSSNFWLGPGGELLCSRCHPKPEIEREE